MAGDLALRGYSVRMYEDAAFIEKLRVLKETLTIRCSGQINGSAKIDWAIDAERKAVGAAFGYKLTPLEDFCEPKDGVLTWQDIYQKMHGAPELTPITGPDSIWNRYLTEDCPNGLVPWSELGKLCGVPTPTMDAIISIYSLVHERDWRSEGITPEKLGLAGLTPEEIRSYLKTGTKCH